MASYRPKHVRKNTGAILVRVLIIVLIVALFAGGGWGVYHFLLDPAARTTPTIPTIQTEATLAPPPTHPPTEAPTEAPTEPDYTEAVKSYLSDMSLDEKIMQLFIVTPEELTGVDVATIAGDTTKERLEKYPVGGIIYSSKNVENEKQIKELLEKTQGYSKTPLFLGVIEEGGSISGIATKLKETVTKDMYEYKDEGEETAQKNAKYIADYLTKYGFNMNLAPNANVWSNQANTVVGSRAYSDDFEKAAALVAAAVKGYDEGSIINAVKQFPGMGDAEESDEYPIPVLNKERDEISSAELKTFKAGIDAGADMVMVGHMMVESLDKDVPTTFSEKIVPELLRVDLAYDGAVVSSSLSAGVITQNYSVEEIVDGLFKADIDIFLTPTDLDAYREAIKSAIENETITEEQIDAKVSRILNIKFKNGLLTAASDETQAPTVSGETVAPEETAAVTEDTAPTEQTEAAN